ncbi:MAG: hypothetical protein J0H94_15525 [Rhizobiales bacterium]|nr:hypothetical protein [Hyphomicrobiales bacterium]
MAETNWPKRYRALANSLLRAAPAARPLLAGFNIFVDATYPMDGARIARLAAEAGRVAAAEDMGPGLAAEILARLGGGRGGAICIDWTAGPAWTTRLLGEPAALQLGGTGPQAAWALAAIGAPAVIALTDRSDEQLSVLHSGISIAAGEGRLLPPQEVTRRTPPQKPRNVILEFTEGTPWPGGSVRRSTRIMLRFIDYGMERDEYFADAARRMATDASALLVAGLDSLPAGDRQSLPWLRRLTRDLRTRGVPATHFELAEFPRRGEMEECARALGGLCDSVGMSLSEARMLTGAEAPPAEAARTVAERFGYATVFVHADDWALAVHRGAADARIRDLMTGNLLASARAFLGRPSPDLAIAPEATFSADIPASGPLGDGWTADCVPSPYLKRPRATVGLGDTFVAGLMLAAGVGPELAPLP